MSFGRSLLVLVVLLSCSCCIDAIEMDCFFEASKITCECIGIDRDTNGFEDLSQLVSSFLFEGGGGGGGFPTPYIRHIAILGCGRMSLIINLRDFVVDFRPQNISIVSFEAVDDLELDFQDIDYGNKQFVFKSVPFLRLTGSLNHYYTRVSFYVHNDLYTKGDVAFENLQAYSTIQLINIQDAKSVRVTNCWFYDLQAVDLLRTDNCYLDSNVVDCSWDDLFVSSWYYGSNWVRHPAFIAFIVILIIAIILAVIGCIYMRTWKRKKELELLGYPASTISRSIPISHPPPPPSSQQQQPPPSGITKVRHFEEYK